MFRYRTAAAVRFMTIILGVVAIVCLGRSADGEPQQSQPSKRVLDLLHERLTVLQDAARLQDLAYSSGESTLDGVLSSERALLDARLELARIREERVQIRVDLARNARRTEEAVTKRAQAREASAMDVLKAKAHRLRAEADLILEQESQAR